MMTTIGQTVVPEGFILAYIPASLLHSLMVSDPASFAITLPVAGEDRVPVTVAASVAAEPVTPADITPAAIPPKRRGRIPGRYRIIDTVTVDETTLTPSERAVFRQMAQRRRGMTARAIATRINTPQGTVGWAIARLVKAGAVEYIAAHTPSKTLAPPALTPEVPVEASPKAHRDHRTHRAPAGYVPLTQHRPTSAQYHA